MSSWPVVNSLVKNWLFKTNHTRLRWPSFQFIHTVDLSGRHDAAWQPRSRNPQDWDLGCLEATGWSQESLEFLDAPVQLLHVRGAVCGALSCWNTKSLPDTLHIAGSSMTSWRHYDIVKSVRDITRISRFITTMKLVFALQVYSADFVKKCMRLHF